MITAGAHAVFFFNDTATTEIYTLSLHDALPISGADFVGIEYIQRIKDGWLDCDVIVATPDVMGQLGQLGKVLRSEEHTSELQSRQYLVCRLLLEKKNYSPNHTDAPLSYRHPPHS